MFVPLRYVNTGHWNGVKKILHQWKASINRLINEVVFNPISERAKYTLESW